MDDEENLGASSAKDPERRKKNKIYLHPNGDLTDRRTRRYEQLTERLQIEREKAYETLGKFANVSSRRSLAPRAADAPTTKSRTSEDLNHTDYVSYKKNEIPNISDLYADHTIPIKSLSIGSDGLFNPSEMTARSTMCVQRRTSPREKSVKAILAESAVKDIRDLSETLPSCDNDTSLVRTADNIPDRDRSSLTKSYRPSFSGCRRDDTSELFGESFKPAEAMASMLSADERSWERQFADIPAYNKNEISLAHLQKQQDDQLDNFSIGDYFQKHSSTLRNMVPNMESPEKRPPVPLRNDSVRTSDQSWSSSSTKPRSEAYGKAFKSTGQTRRDTYRPDPEATRNSNLLDMGAVKEALDAINPDDSINVVKEKLEHVMLGSSSKAARKEPFPVAKVKPAQPNAHETSPAEKENYNPRKIKLGSEYREETASLTESLWNFTEDSCRPESSFTKKLFSNTNKLTVPLRQTGRKRSHSSTRLDPDSPSDHEVPTRRSRSPTSYVELAAVCASGKSPSSSAITTTRKSPHRAISTSESEKFAITETDKRFLLDSKSPECGKFSLPTYGAVTRTVSTISNPVLKSRCNSQCSSSSEFCYRDGLLPLKASILEISWGCVKLRTTVHKSVQIKNVSNKRLIVKAEVTGPGFQLATSSTDASNIIIFHSQECRTLSVSFCPTVIGVAAGQLVFTPNFSHDENNKRTVNLYGCGGHSNISLRGVLKAPEGCSYMPLGEFEQLVSDLEVTFSLVNKGPLTGFTSIIVDSVGLDLPRISDCIQVRPRNLLIKPEDSALITVTFAPRREDIKNIFKKFHKRNCEVITIANLKLLCGEDITRRRIRALINQMNDQEKSELEDMPSLVCSKISGEEPIKHFDVFKEKVNSVHGLLATLKTHEIALTLNYSTLENNSQHSLMFSDNDETVLFRTMICHDAHEHCPQDHEIGADSLEMHRNTIESCSLRPSKLEIDPTNEEVDKATFTIHSNFFLRKPFRIDSNIRHILQCSPCEGNLMPGEEVLVKVRMRAAFLPTEPIKIWVCFEDLKIELPVIIKKDNYPDHFR